MSATVHTHSPTSGSAVDGESRPRLLIITGATRPGRIGPVIADWFQRIAASHDGFELETVDLAELALPILDEPENPARGGVYRNAHTLAWSAIVGRADAVVFVMPEYSHGYNSATKNAIDYLYTEWHDKGVGMVSYGGNVGGGTRAVQALKQVLLAVKAVPVHESVNIPFVYRTLDEHGGFLPTTAFEHDAAAMLDELARREIGLGHLRAAMTGAKSGAHDPLLQLLNTTGTRSSR